MILQPNHVRSLTMAAALMTQWLFNFVIAKLTPIMLARITYGTFLLFGTFCLIMVAFVIVCVPETKGVPLESIHLLFEGSIVKGAVRDTVPKWTRAKGLKDAGRMVIEEERFENGVVMGKGSGGGKGADEFVEEIGSERRSRSDA